MKIQDDYYNLKLINNLFYFFIMTMSICIYSLGSIYKDWGIVRRYDMLLDKNKMVIGGKDSDYDLIKNCDYFIPYKSKKLFGNNGLVFENVYKKIGYPTKIDTIEKWNIEFNNGNNYYDIIEGSPISGLNEYKRLLENKSYDIVWHVEKIKTITLLKKKYNFLPNLKRLSKISESNPHIYELNNIINLSNI